MPPSAFTKAKTKKQTCCICRHTYSPGLRIKHNLVSRSRDSWSHVKEAAPCRDIETDHGRSLRSLVVVWGTSEVQMSESYDLDVINLGELIGAPLQGAHYCAYAPLSAGVFRRKHIHHCVIVKCLPVIEPRGDDWIFTQSRSCGRCVRVLESRTPNQSDHGYSLAHSFSWICAL